LRLNEPTVDLGYEDGYLNAIENGVLTPIAEGSGEITVESIYELDVVREVEEDVV
jgi:hypothetical protein